MQSKKLTAWEKVEIARNPKRKTSLDYIEAIFDDFIELHGDRNFRDDKAMVCGLARIGKQNFTVIAEQKGRTTKENPEGYSSILWKDSTRYKEAAEKMKLTAEDLYDLKVIDKIIKEPKCDEEESFKKIANSLRNEINITISELKQLSAEEIVENRYEKFRNMGEYKEV